MSKLEKILTYAKGQPCVRCGRNDGTTCARHYNGLRQHWYGKGRGIKCHPLMAAHLCMACDKDFSEGVNPYEDKIQRSEEFLHLIALTLINLAKQEKLKV